MHTNTSKYNLSEQSCADEKRCCEEQSSCSPHRIRRSEYDFEIGFLHKRIMKQRVCANKQNFMYTGACDPTRKRETEMELPSISLKPPSP